MCEGFDEPVGVGYLLPDQFFEFSEVLLFKKFFLFKPPEIITNETEQDQSPALVKSSAALCPPKPNVLLIATSIFLD